MAPRFHLLSAEPFVDSVPGDQPTDEDCKKFKKPELRSKMSEHELYPELAAVVQSVLDAAGCDAPRFLDTANHKAKDGNAGKKDTFNDGGIYMNSPLAREATEFTSEHRDKSQATPEQLVQRLLRLRSWNWIDILFEVKMSESLAAFYFKIKPRGYKDVVQASALTPDPTSGTPRHGGKGCAVDDEGGVMEREDKEDELPRQDDIASSSKGMSVAHDAPSIPNTSAPDHLPASDHGAKETETKPGMATRQVPPFVKVYGDGPLGQFIEYMLNVQKNQHRAFSYAVYICYDMARLFYFDRSGAFVSEPFRWDEKDSFLHQFVWKIAKLANAGRFEDLGHDPAAKLASGEAKDKFLALKDDKSLPPHIRDGFKKATADKWPIYKLEVAPGEPSKDEWFDDITFPPPKDFSGPSPPSPSQSISMPLSKPSSSSDPLPSPSSNPTPSIRQFLVGRPHFAADGLVGRCTRGYFAYDVTDTDQKNWRVCFLKDSWRPVVPGRTRPEHLVYQRLRSCGVNRGIGTLICGGDVGGHWAQRTRVQDYLPEKNRPVPRVHYRLVIEEIGIRLEDFDSFPELSAIFVDAIQAHHKAWTLAHVLHRDISVGNIMILPPTGNSRRRRGILIDWDLSRLECELGSGPVEPDRTGTWQFRSALSLLYPWKPYRRSDDIESFIHVYIYLVLRFHPINIRSLKELVISLFEGASLVRGIKTGGDRKLALFLSAKLPFKASANPRLQKLIQDIISGCSKSYGMVDLDEMEQRYGFDLLSDSEQPLPAVPDHTTAPIVDFDSDDDIPRFVAQPDSPSVTAAPTDHKDPCVVDGFLSEVGNLLDLLKGHAATRLPSSDKACDQFPARKHEDVYRGPNNAGSRRIGSMSTSGTILSQGVSSNASGFSLNFGSRPGSNFAPGPSTAGTSSDSRKRMRAEPHVKGAAAKLNEEEPSDSLHRSKRAK